MSRLISRAALTFSKRASRPRLPLTRRDRPHLVHATSIHQVLARTTHDEVIRRIAAHMLEYSKRTPTELRTWNCADEIEDNLQMDGHKLWGFVIYRSTYASNEDWRRVLNIIMSKVKEKPKQANGMDIFESFKLPVFEGRPQYDGATTSYIREDFKRWLQTAEEDEQGFAYKDTATYRYRAGGGWIALRYGYCIQIDEESMKSILAKPDFGGRVKLIQVSWNPDVEDNDNEPIEGCTLWDVGWMRLRHDSVMSEWFGHLRESWQWQHAEYQRPPAIPIS